MRLLIITALVLTCPAVFSQANAEMLTRLKNSPKDTATVRLYGKVSRFYISTKPDSATYYIGEGLKLAKELKDRKGEAMMLSQLGVVNEQHGNMVLAEKYATEALNIFKELKEIYPIATCLNTVGVIEAKKGNFAKAVSYFLDALAMFKSINDKHGITQSYIKLGTVHDYNGNIDKSLEYYNKAWELNNGDTLNNAYYSLCNNIGIVYGRKGDLKKAIEYFEAGIKTSNTPIFMDVHISLLNNAMKAYAQMGDKKKAFEYHKIVIDIARKNDIPEEEARTLINFADAHHDNPALALDYLKQALSISIRIGNRPITADVYSAMVEVYKQLGNYKEALSFMTEYSQMQDSLFSINKTRELASLFASYEMNEAKNHVQELQLVNQKRTFERNLVTIAIACILVILILLWFYYKKMGALNKQLQESNKIKDKLFSIIGHDLKAPVGGLVQTLELMEDDALDAEERKYVVGQLRKQTQLSLDTLNALLNWGEAQLKGVSVNPLQFETKEIITKSTEMLSKQAAAKSITLIDNTSNELKLFADINHFDFVVRNLLSNAIKFTNIDGKVEINAIKNAKDNTVTFSVKDNGQGISMEEQKQFLKSNIKVNYGTKGEKGTGLGLLLTKEFIQANKGKIWLESKEGEGTTFYFSLKKG